MRLLLAGLVTYGGLLASAALVFHHFPDGFGPPWLPGLVLGLLACLLAVTSFAFFNRFRRRPGATGSLAEHLAKLEGAGLVETVEYEVRRNFRVEEFEDEGPHYFLDLGEGGVLCLCGQYLDDLEEPVPGPDGRVAPVFPSTRITVRRRRDTGEVLDVGCHGVYLPPECEAPPYDKADLAWDDNAGDGDIIRDRSYGQLKAERLKRSS